MLPVKKRAFKTPSSNFKDSNSTDPLILAQPLATSSEAAPASFIHKPAAKRRRLLVCPILGSKEERILGPKVPNPTPLLTDGNSSATSEWCPRPLEEIPWSSDDFTAPAHYKGETQQQPPKSVSMSAQPLVNLETVHRLQAHLVPHFTPCLPVHSPSPTLSNKAEKSPLSTREVEVRKKVGDGRSDKATAAKDQRRLIPPFRVGKPRADRRLRQSKLEDFALSKKTCKGPGQLLAQSLAPIPSATVREAESGAEKTKSESQLSTAVAEQLNLQDDKWREIWNSPEKQLQEMMKAPALPFVHYLDMEFLREIF